MREASMLLLLLEDEMLPISETNAAVTTRSRGASRKISSSTRQPSHRYRSRQEAFARITPTGKGSSLRHVGLRCKKRRSAERHHIRLSLSAHEYIHNSSLSPSTSSRLPALTASGFSWPSKRTAYRPLLIVESLAHANHAIQLWLRLKAHQPHLLPNQTLEPMLLSRRRRHAPVRFERLRSLELVAELL